jgi:hypothetical protein
VLSLASENFNGRKQSHSDKQKVRKMNDAFVTVLYVLAYVLNLFIIHSFYSNHITKMLQNWGNYADMSQAVIIYMTFASDVLLICWCGTQLTQHVRDNYIMLNKLRKQYGGFSRNYDIRFVLSSQ